MDWFVRNFKWVMLVSGLLTLTMVQAAFAPQAALRLTPAERRAPGGSRPCDTVSMSA